MLAELLNLNIFAFFLIFARLGTALIGMVGFSAAWVSPRFRLGIGLSISLVLLPVVGPDLPDIPGTTIELIILMINEVIIGAFFAVLSLIIIASLQTAGSIIALLSSMANALIQDPLVEQQSSTIAGFLATVALTLVFVTDLYQVMLAALVDSYALFPPGAAFQWGDTANLIARRVADSFYLGLQMASPFLLTGLTYYFGIGLLGRLMPTLPIFFFGLPVQITMQIWVLIVSVSAIMLSFMNHFSEGYAPFLIP